MATYYISPTGNDNNNSGTTSSPWFSLNKAWTIIHSGDTVYMRGGTYSYSTQQVMNGVNGVSGGTINIFAYSGETPIITKGSGYTYNDTYGYGCYFSGDYFHFKGIEISGFTQETEHVWHGLRAYGSHNTFELLNSHHNGAGMLLGEGSNDNLILNCDFHHNVDLLSPIPYNNAAGLSTSRNTNTSATNTVRGCRAWWNADTGFDAYYNEGFVTWDNCWSFYNGYVPDTFTPTRPDEMGEGAGWKYGETEYEYPNTHKRTITNCLAFKNKATGFFINGAVLISHTYNCTAYLNGWIGFCLNMDVPHVVRNNISYQSGSYNCSLGTHTGMTNDHNTFIAIEVENTGYTISDADFVFISGYTTQLFGSRKPDGSLPDITFLHLAEGSDLIDAGIDVGLPYSGISPDLGCFESTGTTYYISESGDDTGGTGSILNPWRTLRYACTQVTTSGNTIYVSGGTYTETSGSTILLSPGVNITGEGDSSHIILTFYSNDWDVGAIHLTGDENTIGNQEISNIKLDGQLTASRCLSINKVGYVKVHNCTIVDFIECGILVRGNNWDGTAFAYNNEIYDCTITNCAHREEGQSTGLIIYVYQDGLKIYNNILDQTTRSLSSNGNGNILNGINAHNRNIKFYNNKCYKPVYNGSFWNFHIENWHIEGGFEIYNNEFYGGDCVVDCAGGIKSGYSYSYYIHDNYIEYSTGVTTPSYHGTCAIDIEGTPTEDLIISNNHFVGWPECIGTTDGGSPGASSHHSNIWIYDNLFEECGYSNASYSGEVLHFNIYLFTGSTVSNAYIWNNTILSDHTSPNDGILIQSSGIINNIEIINNIFSGFTNHSFFRSENTGSLSGLTITNNITYQNANSNDPTFTGNSPSGYTLSDNIKSDPLFVSSTDFSLQSSSPAIDAGVDVGLPYSGTAPDIGAFEYTGFTGNIYYVSSSSGDDSYDGTIENPWKTINKVNSYSANYNAGDSILFKKGDTFILTEKLFIDKSGDSGGTITISSYGTGENPILSGFEVLSGWTSYGDGIYYTNTSCDTQDEYSQVYIVIVDGVNTPMGRYPKSDWLSYDHADYDGQYYFTDSHLTGATNWTGAEAVMQKVRWMVDRNKITSHSGTRVNYLKGSNWYASDNYGYFFQNDIKCLTELGDWCYTGNTIYMYFGGVDPSTKIVKIATRNTGIEVYYKSYQTYENLTVEGINWYGFNNRASLNISIKNCEFRFIGMYGILNNPFDGTSSIYIDSNYLHDITGTAINIRGYGHSMIIKNNDLENIGMLPGGVALSADDVWADGIVVVHDGTIVENNRLINIGHIGIKCMTASDLTIRYNYVDGFGLTRYDAGGIYTWDDSVTRSGNTIDHNILMNSRQTSDSIGGDTYLALYGIYHDEHGEGWVDSFNTSYNCSSSGLLILASNNITVSGNTFYNNGESQLSISDFWFDVYVTGNTIKDNYFISRTLDQLCMECNSQYDAIRDIGLFDNNIYARPIDDNLTITTNTNMYNPDPTYLTLNGWKTYSSQDSNSNKSPVTLDNVNKILFYYNTGATSRTISLSSDYKDVANNSYSTSVTVDSFESIVLLEYSPSVLTKSYSIGGRPLSINGKVIIISG